MRVPLTKQVKSEISYKHAWLLLNDIEKSLGEPVIIKNGEGRNRTFLTEKAVKLLEEYNTYQKYLGKQFTTKLSGGDRCENICKKPDERRIKGLKRGSYSKGQDRCGTFNHNCDHNKRSC